MKTKIIKIRKTSLPRDRKDWPHMTVGGMFGYTKEEVVVCPLCFTTHKIIKT